MFGKDSTTLSPGWAPTRLIYRNARFVVNSRPVLILEGPFASAHLEAKAGGSIEIDASPDRHLYLVPSGRVRVNGVAAGSRDGVAITGETRLTITAEDDSELVLVDAR